MPSSLQLHGTPAPPLSVTDGAIAPSARKTVNGEEEEYERVKVTMKMKVNLRVMRVKTQSLKVKIQVVGSTISIR